MDDHRKTFSVENNYRNETTFALSNGYIGTRGTFEEAYPFDIDTGLEGNFINGFTSGKKSVMEKRILVPPSQPVPFKSAQSKRNPVAFGGRGI